MIFISKKNYNFSGKTIEFDPPGMTIKKNLLNKAEVESLPAIGAGVGALAGGLAGGALGLSSAAGHVISGMTDVGYKNNLAGGAMSTLIPAAGGLLVGGVPGSIAHGIAGLGGYIYGKNKRDKSKKKATIGDLLKTGTAVGLGGAALGAVGGGVLGMGSGLVARDVANSIREDDFFAHLK